VINEHLQHDQDHSHVCLVKVLWKRAAAGTGDIVVLQPQACCIARRVWFSCAVYTICVVFFAFACSAVGSTGDVTIFTLTASNSSSLVGHHRGVLDAAIAGIYQERCCLP
jgi:hypothetical protein